MSLLVPFQLLESERKYTSPTFCSARCVSTRGPLGEQVGTALGRRGFTLVELLIALVLLGIVSAGIYRVLLNMQRVNQAQTARIELQQNIRAAAAILPAEFRELNATGGDITAMSATSVSIRAMRQFAFICNTPAIAGNTVTMTIRVAPFYGPRDFTIATDSILVYYEGAQDSRSDDQWLRGNITSITNNVPCVPDGAPGRQLVTTLSFAAPPAVPGFPNVPAPVAQTGTIESGAPIRGFETVTYKLYQGSDGKWYLGYQNSSGTQPLIGPVTTNGLTFTYYDSTGAVTGTATSVAQVGITLRGEASQPIEQPNVGLVTPVDSISTRVTLRNNRRW